MKRLGHFDGYLLLGAVALPFSLAVSPAFAQDDFDIGAAPAQKTPPPVLTNAVEVGVGYQNLDSYYFGRYGGVTGEGPFPLFDATVNGRSPWDSNRTWFWNVDASLYGADARTVQARVGEQGKWKFSANYDAFTRSFTESAQTPFDGVGTSQLTLPANWTGNIFSQRFANLGRDLKPLELKTAWQSVGGDYVMNPRNGYEIRFHFDYRHRDGLRPNSIAFGNESNFPVGLFFPQPVDYDSNRFEASIGYADRQWQWNAMYTFSIFRDALNSVTVQNPFSQSIAFSWPAGGFAGYPFASGQYSLPPDSSAHQILLSGGYAVTPKTRITARVAFTIQTQNAPFLPYTSNLNLNVPLPLPRSSLGGLDHKTMANFAVTSREWKNWDLSASYAYDGRKNLTPQAAFSYVTNDVQDQPHPLIPGVSPYIRTNLPYSFTFQQAKAEVAYRVTPGTRISLSYTGDFQSRTYQEVSKTVEHTVKAKALSAFALGSGWVSYSYAARTGTNYADDYPWNLSHTAAYLNASPNNRSIEFPLLRKYELADRERHEVKGGLTFDPMPAVTVDMSGGYDKDIYNKSLFGLRHSDSLLLDVDLSYVVKDGLSASAFYSFEQIRSDQRGYFLATLSLTNPAQAWGAQNRDSVHSVGLQADWQAVPNKLMLHGAYYLSYGATHIDVESTPFIPLAAASPLPDAHEITHNVRLRAEYAVRNGTTLRLGYTLERHITTDWQYAGGFTPVAQILGSGMLPPRYTAHVVSISARHEF
ncbi:MAG: MtrB/PioB family decaheme-associated outer membrane protein [Rhodospirillaceae bacterium]|nr:MAG: MtrB/PioB family decaheme-associated outer membrane protein [Rhodospirillaceae bacterium]